MTEKDKLDCKLAALTPKKFLKLCRNQKRWGHFEAMLVEEYMSAVGKLNIEKIKELADLGSFVGKHSKQVALMQIVEMTPGYKPGHDISDITKEQWLFRVGGILLTVSPSISADMQIEILGRDFKSLEDIDDLGFI